MEPLEPIEDSGAAPAATRSSARLLGIAAVVVGTVALVALALVQSDTGKPEPGDPQQAGQSSGGPSTVAESLTTTTMGSAETTSPGGRAPGEVTTTTAPMPTIPASPEDYKYQVTLSATCAHPGDSFTVVMHLQRDDTASMLVRYADHQDHGARKAGAAGSDGRFEYTFTIGPTLGKATVLTSAYRRADGRSGTTSMTFEVIEATRDC